MKPALHRSVWFWLGCFVLLFLVWVWVDSRKTQTQVLFRVWSFERWSATFAGVPYYVGVQYEEGCRVDSGRVQITWSRVTRMGPGMRVRARPAHIGRVQAMLGGEWFARPMTNRYEDHATEEGTVMVNVVEVPMWGIVLLYLMGCGGVVVWRRRRLKRGVKLLEEGAVT